MGDLGWSLGVGGGSCAEGQSLIGEGPGPATFFFGFFGCPGGLVVMRPRTLFSDNLQSETRTSQGEAQQAQHGMLGTGFGVRETLGLPQCSCVAVAFSGSSSPSCVLVSFKPQNVSAGRSL